MARLLCVWSQPGLEWDPVSENNKESNKDIRKQEMENLVSIYVWMRNHGQRWLGQVGWERYLWKAEKCYFSWWTWGIRLRSAPPIVSLPLATTWEQARSTCYVAAGRCLSACTHSVRREPSALLIGWTLGRARLYILLPEGQVSSDASRVRRRRLLTWAAEVRR